MTPIKAQNKEHLRAIVRGHINQYGNEVNMNHVDVSAIHDFSQLFHDSDFNGDISGWNVSRGVIFNQMFMQSKFQGNISNWDVSQATQMGSMFAESIFNGDISRWDVSNVYNMNAMFCGAAFDGDISKWNTQSLLSATYMFANSPFQGDVSSWNVQSLLEANSMFHACDINSSNMFSHWNFSENVSVFRFLGDLLESSTLLKLGQLKESPLMFALYAMLPSDKRPAEYQHLFGMVEQLCNDQSPMKKGYVLYHLYSNQQPEMLISDFHFD